MDVDYGPLAGFIGLWEGANGVDVSPEPEANERSAYYERLLFEPAGDVDNADTQDLVMLRYNQTVFRTRNDEVFHNEAGFLIWDAERQLVMQSFAIPRGLALVAGGGVQSSGDSIEIDLAAQEGDEQWPISQAPFLAKNARTRRFTRTYRLNGDELGYEQTTLLDIYGREVAHTDSNLLTRTS